MPAPWPRLSVRRWHVKRQTAKRFNEVLYSGITQRWKETSREYQNTPTIEDLYKVEDKAELVHGEIVHKAPTGPSITDAAIRRHCLLIVPESVASHVQGVRMNCTIFPREPRRAIPC